MLSHIARVLFVLFAAMACSEPALAQGWQPFSFQGTEHFKFEAEVTQGGETDTGWYTMDFAPQGEDRVKLTFRGSLGESSGEFSTTAPRDEVYAQVIMQSMMTPVGAPLMVTLFAPFWGMYFVGQDWEVGSGWSFDQGGESMSFKVESTCSHAGVSGKKVVWREGGEVRSECCISQDVALPLAVLFRDDDGEVFRLTLTEYSP